jgi:peptidoglycan/LPS O-acetylase OafA/YrhL
MLGKVIYYLFYNGDLGVHFFFVLSGFLIAIKLIDEKDETACVNLGHFYKKRILRIWPVYFLVLCGVCFNASWLAQYTAPQLSLSPQFDKPAFYHYLFFLGNFELITQGIKNHFITVLWSISVEEQFYLLCPLCVKLTHKRGFAVILSSLVIIAVGYRLIFCAVGDMAFKYHSLAMALYLSVGCLCAWLTRKTNIIAHLKALSTWQIVSVYTLGVTLLPMRRLLWSNSVNDRLLGNSIYIFEALLFGFIILEQNFSEKSFYKASSSPMASTLGKRTYGMYAYHLICMMLGLFIIGLLGGSLIQISFITMSGISLLALVITLGFAELSFRTLERWFLKLR